MATEFKLPELGENVNSATVAKILVSINDKINKDQPLLELETDKAVLEVPSTMEGVVEAILVKLGDQITPDQPVLVINEKKKSDEKEVSQKSEPMVLPVNNDIPSAQIKTDQNIEETAEMKNDDGQLVEIKLPELGENISSGTVVKVTVSVGDQIDKNQTLMELETDKAVLEVPAEYPGRIKDIFISEGEEVKVGQTVLTLITADSTMVREQEKVFISGQEAKVKKEQYINAVPAQSKPSIINPAAKRKQLAPAAPSVRRFSREIGIDINHVPGTGPGGRISVEDIKRYSKSLNAQRVANRTVLKGVEPESLPDFSKWGEITFESMSNVREKTARHLSYAWLTIPQVTNFDKADITELEQLRKKFSKNAAAAGSKLTMTSILIKVLGIALKLFPKFNASVDMKNNQIVYKKYFNIGVAVDTDRGLLVPVIKQVDKKNVKEIAAELVILAEKARNRKLTLEEMQGGNFSISNLGSIGGTGFSPIIHSPEVAIMGVSRAQTEAILVNDTFRPRLMLPLSLSYDHRLIDGADAARFLKWVVDALEQPFLLTLEG